MQTFASVRFGRRALRPLLALPIALATLSACGGESAGDEAAVVAAGGEVAPADSAQGAQAAAPAVDPGPVADLPANELGRFMVLEYHRLGTNEGEWVRTKENFQKDLQALYERGYRPVTMKQMLSGDIDLPAGTTPVVFTMDDSSLGQFYYREDGSIDPNTMVGMWDAFQKQNPAWQNGAVWCVLPAADHPSNFFGEKPSREVPREQREATIRKKIEYLVQNDHEICNHTLYHARLDRGTDAQVQEWLGRGEDSIQVYLPEGYDIVTHALPLGMWPKNRSLAWKGTWPGRQGENRPVNYQYEAVLEVSGGPSVSVYDQSWDPHSVDRFIVAPGALERQLRAWESDPSSRFVSDGDPNTIAVPQGRAGQVDRARFPNKQVREVAPAAAPATPAPTAGS